MVRQTPNIYYSRYHLDVCIHSPHYRRRQSNDNTRTRKSKLLQETNDYDNHRPPLRRNVDPHLPIDSGPHCRNYLPHNGYIHSDHLHRRCSGILLSVNLHRPTTSSGPGSTQNRKTSHQDHHPTHSHLRHQPDPNDILPRYALHQSTPRRHPRRNIHSRDHHYIINMLHQPSVLLRH